MRLAYYPGCSLSSTGREYDLSLRAVAARLDIGLEELPDWNCCGASAAHSLSPTLSLALPVRVLLQAESSGRDLLVPCAGCFSRLQAARRALTEPAHREYWEQLGGGCWQGRVRVLSLLQLLATIGSEQICRQQQRSLAGLRLAAYYGCLLVRPELGDPENPKSMEALLQALGAEMVDWPFKTSCCGAGLGLPRPDLVTAMVGRLAAAAAAEGAQALVTACPLCQLNLEMRQSGAGGAAVGGPLPALYLTQLLGWALGLSVEELGLDRHLCDPRPVLVGAVRLGGDG